MILTKQAGKKPIALGATELSHRHGQCNSTSTIPTITIAAQSVGSMPRPGRDCLNITERHSIGLCARAVTMEQEQPGLLVQTNISTIYKMKMFARLVNNTLTAQAILNM